MEWLKSKLGLILSGLYILVSIVLIVSQGLFGESFIALLLGLPWSLLFALFEYGQVNGVLLYVFLLGPLVLNAVLLYWLGAFIQERKIAQIIGLLVVVITVTCLAYFLYPRANQVPLPTPTDIIRQPGTISGTYMCLPHRDTSGPQTLECALGIQADDGRYYALDFNAVAGNPPSFATGERISVSGIITPVEMLSSDHWQKYPITGILSVSSSDRQSAIAE